MRHELAVRPTSARPGRYRRHLQHDVVSHQSGQGIHVGPLDRSGVALDPFGGQRAAAGAAPRRRAARARWRAELTAARWSPAPRRSRRRAAQHLTQHERATLAGEAAPAASRSPPAARRRLAPRPPHLDAADHAARSRHQPGDVQSRHQRGADLDAWVLQVARKRPRARRATGPRRRCARCGSTRWTAMPATRRRTPATARPAPSRPARRPRRRTATPTSGSRTRPTAAQRRQRLRRQSGHGHHVHTGPATADSRRRKVRSWTSARCQTGSR